MSSSPSTPRFDSVCGTTDPPQRPDLPSRNVRSALLTTTAAHSAVAGSPSYVHTHQTSSRKLMPAKPTRKPPPPPVQLPPHNALVLPRSRTASGPTATSPRLPELSPRLTPEELEANRRHERVKAIFRPLEEYVSSSFGSFDCLNASFSTARPSPVGRTHSDSSIKTTAASKEAEDFNPPVDFWSGLDAKTLLLGDFAENGSWWTGRVSRNHSYKESSRRDKPAEQTRRVVTSKTPQIDWAALGKWYDTIHRAGENWKDKVDRLKTSTHQLTLDTHEDVREVEIDMREASLHVQRALLKVTENLLKRPRRPLKEPSDVRFLLILLANPSLYPPSIDTSRLRSASQPKISASSMHASHPEVLALFQSGASPSPSRPLQAGNREPGQHSGIVKRIFGLLANTPSDCHRYLIAWFSRFSEDRFQHIMNLVASFVTYRLVRQQGRKRSNSNNPDGGLIPDLSGSSRSTSVQLHAALGLSGATKNEEDAAQGIEYGNDWQLRAGAKVMALLFAANNSYYARKIDFVNTVSSEGDLPSSGLAARERARSHGQLLPTSTFYNTLLDYYDLIADFRAWESRRAKFSFCQYPFLLSMGAKIKIMEYDARRQMEIKARETFFNNVNTHRAVDQYLVLRVRRECMVEDSLRQISEVVGAGQEDIKKGLRVHFQGEEGVDAGGLRKEWFLLLVRDIFDPNHDQYYLVGALLGLAIYNSTILDVALPPFAFRKLLASAPTPSTPSTLARAPMTYTLSDLAEFRPALAAGLRQLLDFDGDVESTFCRDFVAEIERYGSITTVPLCPNGENKAVTNENRHEFVELYVRYLLDTSVVRQFEPFKRGFFTVCAGNALSLFRPEEIELLIRGSDEALDVSSVRAVAVYEGWKDDNTNKALSRDDVEELWVIRWFWELFEGAGSQDQRKLLSFITGSDRIPAVGATNLVVKIVSAGPDSERFPVARTCFNQLVLPQYGSRRKLENKLWRAVRESGGFGLK
ncbi:hypothetical protein LTR04_004001 [Oleoguttula sp. CCFEE 6159]|nr:hypothetical protein LTR04_004001 [Oleoguttula sp. CCFEE 6159]